MEGRMWIPLLLTLRGSSRRTSQEEQYLIRASLPFPYSSLDHPDLQGMRWAE